jgi:hypothetical protein
MLHSTTRVDGSSNRPDQKQGLLSRRRQLKCRHFVACLSEIPKYTPDTSLLPVRILWPMHTHAAAACQGFGDTHMQLLRVRDSAAHTHTHMPLLRDRDLAGKACMNRPRLPTK